MLTFRKANQEDIDVLFTWINDLDVRSNSYNKELISYETHKNWFNERINSVNFLFLIFSNESFPIGQIRFELLNNTEAVISILIDKNHRGKGYASKMILESSIFFLEQHIGYIIYAYIFKENKISIKAFEKAGYVLSEEKEINNIWSCIFYKK